MRKKVREAVHENRNLSMIAGAESHRALKSSFMARIAAHEVIKKIEQTRKDRKRDDKIAPS